MPSSASHATTVTRRDEDTRAGPNRASRVLANDGHTLAGRNVVARAPVNVIPSVKDLGKNLLLPGQAVAATHG